MTFIKEHASSLNQIKMPNKVTRYLQICRRQLQIIIWILSTKRCWKKWKFTNLACNILNLHNIVRLWLVWQVWLIKSSYPQLIGWVWLITGGVPNFWSRLSKKILSFLRLLKPGYFHPPGWLDCFLVGWAWAGVVALCTPLGVHLPHQPLDEVADIYPCKASWKNMAPKGFPAQS